MSGKCHKNCDLDCNPRYQQKAHPFIAGPEHDRAVWRRARISEGQRKRLRKAGKVPR